MALAMARPDSALAMAPPDCTQAAEAASRVAGLPSGLLDAIGVVESGRVGADGVRRPFPDTVDVDGAGHWFADAGSAAAFAASTIATGARSVDIGCFQIDLEDHPGAFVSLAQGFDPTANANAAAGFLRRLHTRLGSWTAAIAAYHSATPALGEPYARLVAAAWHGGTPAPVAPTDPYVIRLGGKRGSLPRIVTP